MIGMTRKEFASHFAHFLRRRGRLTPEAFAAEIGEIPAICRAVFEGKDDPTGAILRAMDWVQFDHSYYAWALITEKRFMPKKKALISEEDL